MQFYVTPNGLVYLNQILLTTLVSGYLVRTALRSGRRYTWLLAGFFITLTTFLGTLWLEVSFLPTPRLYSVIAQNSLLGFALIFLLQFVYHFPVLPPRWRVEARIALIFSILYTLGEVGYAVYRLWKLQQGVVLFRHEVIDYLLFGIFMWVPLVLVRQMYMLTPVPSDRGRSQWFYPFLNPGSSEASTIRVFTIIFFFVASLNLISILLHTTLILATVANAILSLGILVAIFGFVISYLNAQPETTSFLVRMIGISLITNMGLLGMVGWIISTNRETGFTVEIPRQQSFRFSPNEAGGYDVDRIPFQFKTMRGEELQLDLHALHECSSPLTFAFPFFGQDHEHLYACRDGVVSFDAPVRYRSFQYSYGAGAPLMFALLIDFDHRLSSGGVFAYQQDDQLIINWERMRNAYRPADEYTFQAVLYSSGIFEFNYAERPELLHYYPNDEPGANPWVIGAVPGQLRGPMPQLMTLDRLPASSGSEGVIKDYLVEYRQRLHSLLHPLVQLFFATNILILVVFPFFFRVTLLRPLNSLLSGVQAMEEGRYPANLRVYYQDEVGFLTKAFQRLSTELANLIQTLEERVANRTAELDASNAQLRTEMSKRQEAQVQALQHQRTLAVLEERYRLGRELHDSLGQVFGSINLQAQALEAFLRNRDTLAAEQACRHIGEAARQGHADVRSFILGLRHSSVQGFWEMLNHTLDEVRRRSNLTLTLHAPEPWQEAWLSPIGQLHLLRILQEALHNAEQHAQAARIDVTFERKGTLLLVTIQDDGQGFVRDRYEETDPAALIPVLSRSSHFGLKTMEERARELGGGVEIYTAPGLGTRILVTCHLERVEEEPLATLPTRPLRVVLVDDHPMFLEGLRNFLTAHGMQVIGTGSDGEEAQMLARTLRPDLLVIDLQMPRCDGLEATRRITAEWPEARIVVLTVSAEETLLFEALKAGASGYLLKNMQADDLFLLLAGLEQGAPPIAPELAQRIDVELARQEADEVAAEARLSPQQRNILILVAQGLTYREVAQEVHLSEAAIKYHMKQILNRLHLANRTEAVAYARRSGMVAERTKTE
ncbi:helix-turn-helix transcriptional regulator [Candidatus Chloroploca asiatica]|uniref:helix-turn-helix transcriptional regulator n=1 Tax=Candidatus Chloroploca asiatica TaxID=1506545 RepID=UPI000BE7ABD5|nr:hybrid sensor histidine kinase/response regulator transcription factor [Candidatus Chloroploca asiatica]